MQSIQVSPVGIQLVKDAVSVWLTVSWVLVLSHRHPFGMFKAVLKGLIWKYSEGCLIGTSRQSMR